VEEVRIHRAEYLKRQVYAIVDRRPFCEWEAHGRVHQLRCSFDEGTGSAPVAKRESSQGQFAWTTRAHWSMDERFFRVPRPCKRAGEGFQTTAPPSGRQSRVREPARDSGMVSWRDIGKRTAAFSHHLEICDGTPFCEDRSMAAGRTEGVSDWSGAICWSQPCQRCVVPTAIPIARTGPDFQKKFMQLRREHFPNGERAALQSFLSIRGHTSIPQRSGKQLRTGDPLNF